MERENHYETVSEAINELQQKGFTIDFNLKENSLDQHPEKFATEFEIVEVYRYEGNSDPGDEAVVYALESKSGEKGLLVTGYGISVDSKTTEILKKLPIRSDNPIKP
ncbi:MAG: hypothetical protein K0S53_1905 [Bacteroidetes bacterium]|jgi:hypothetical protein|nr:hypothetical protein [Bacteroidota bacterium]